jgi:hypothetical protein|tara:strand:- start:245 stop:541 length:297 start_codon:yes stop_codon:yes gene_type:complete
MENQIDQLLKMKDLINKIQIDYNNQVDELKTVTERLEKYKSYQLVIKEDISYLRNYIIRQNKKLREIDDDKEKADTYPIIMEQIVSLLNAMEKEHPFY